MALVAEPVAIVGAPAAASVIRGKLHAVFEHAVGQHGQIEPPAVEGHHRRVPFSDEVREFLQDLRLVGRRIFLSTKGAELQELVLGIEPQHPEGDHLMKRGRRKTTDRRVPSQIRVGNGFDVEDEKRSGHGQKLAEKFAERSPALRLA